MTYINLQPPGRPRNGKNCHALRSVGASVAGFMVDEWIGGRRAEG